MACGPGVERLAEEVDESFPDARIIVLSSDMAGGVSRLRLELEAIAKGEVDIVIGTQLVAKGHNFPLITCVGVVDALVHALHEVSPEPRDVVDYHEDTMGQGSDARAIAMMGDVTQ